MRDANYERVKAVLNRMLKEDSGIRCTCPECISALTARALNCLLPHYYSERDRSGCNGSPWEVVTAAVREAMEEQRSFHKIIR